MTAPSNTAVLAPRPPRALTIAGSDSGGGAGIQADLKTFTALSSYGMSVITALTAQNTLGVQGIHSVPPEFIRTQFNSVAADLGIDAVKTGMLATTDVIAEVAAALATPPAGDSERPWLTVDPVMVATSGDPLLAAEAVGTMVRDLLPLADVLTPNIPEAELLLKFVQPPSDDDTQVGPIDSLDAMKRAARALSTLGPRFVLVKGGHLPLDAASLLPATAGKDMVCIDVLYDAVTHEYSVFRTPRIATSSTHGTGCTLSAAITAYLARRPRATATNAPAVRTIVVDAVRRAIAYTHNAIKYAQAGLGAGHGPLNHGFAIEGGMAVAVGEELPVSAKAVVVEAGVDIAPASTSDRQNGGTASNGDAADDHQVVTLTELGWRREAQLLHTPRSIVSLLKNACGKDWYDYTHHKFVRGMGDGTLPEDCFRHYLTQDYVFLTHYARCNALAAYKAQNMADSVFSAKIVVHIANEAQLHVGYCAEWGIDAQALAATTEARPNMAYTRFTLDRGMSGDLLDLRAALAPCLFGYGDIGVWLMKDANTVKDDTKNRYWRWVQNYAKPDFQQACEDGEVLMERLAVELGVWHAPARIESLIDTFRKATRLEIGFWEMGWNKEW